MAVISFFFFSVRCTFLLTYSLAATSGLLPSPNVIHVSHFVSIIIAPTPYSPPTPIRCVHRTFLEEEKKKNYTKREGGIG